MQLKFKGKGEKKKTLLYPTTWRDQNQLWDQVAGFVRTGLKMSPALFYLPSRMDMTSSLQKVSPGSGCETSPGHWTVFCGQLQTLPLTGALVTWVFEKLQTASFYPFWEAKILFGLTPTVFSFAPLKPTGLSQWPRANMCLPQIFHQLQTHQARVVKIARLSYYFHWC